SGIRGSSTRQPSLEPVRRTRTSLVVWLEEWIINHSLLRDLPTPVFIDSSGSSYTSSSVLSPNRWHHTCHERLVASCSTPYHNVRLSESHATDVTRSRTRSRWSPVRRSLIRRVYWRKPVSSVE